MKQTSKKYRSKIQMLRINHKHKIRATRRTRQPVFPPKGRPLRSLPRRRECRLATSAQARIQVMAPQSTRNGLGPCTSRLAGGQFSYPPLNGAGERTAKTAVRNGRCPIRTRKQKRHNRQEKTYRGVNKH